MRKFWLRINATGEVLDLNGATAVSSSGKPTKASEQLVGIMSLSDIQGLGYTRKLTFAHINNGKYIAVNDEIGQTVVAGTLTLKPRISNGRKFTAYDGFNEFINLIGNQLLTLLYAPDGILKNAYSLDGYISKIDKTELRAGQWLQCPVEFVSIAPWYKVSKTISIGSNSVISSDYTQTMTLDETLYQGLRTELTISTEMRNGLSLYVKSLDKTETYGGISIRGKLATGSKIIWDTNPNKAIITVDDANALNRLEVGTSRLFPVVNGSSSMEFILSDGGLNGSIYVTNYFRAV